MAESQTGPELSPEDSRTEDLRPEELRQADLSHLHVSQMNEAQKRELRRRYDEFVKGLAKPKDNPAVAIRSPGPVKWMPKKVR